jgi:RecA-family ATPase
MPRIEDVQSDIDDWEYPPASAYEEPAAGAPKANGQHKAGLPKAEPPIQWGSLVGEPPPRLWWIQDWLGPSPTLLSGAGGAGKTRLLQMIATSLATGKRYFADQVQPLNVLVWSCEENKDEVWRQQYAINAHFGHDMRELDRLHVVPRHGHDNTLLSLTFGAPTMTPLLAQLREQVNDLAADVLVLDNLAQVFGGNENDRHQATYFVNAISGLVRERPFAPVFLGHVARAQGSEYSGSAAWENAVRMRWYLGATLPGAAADPEADEQVDPEVVYLCRRKANYAAKDTIKMRFQNGLLIPESVPDGMQFTEMFRAENAEQVLIGAFLKLKDMGIRATDGKTSSDYLPLQIMSKQLNQSHSKIEMVMAMNRLMAKGRLKRGEIGKHSNRMPKFGLLLV